YHRAATFDCDWAIYNYAQLLAHGRGVPQDRRAALLWFRLAATRGHARAMNFLGEFYENGWEVPADRATAFDWYRRSAEGGDFRGQCSHASVLAEQGRINEALYWLRHAATTATPAYIKHLIATLQRAPHPALREFAAMLAARAPRSSTVPCGPAMLSDVGP
ncbi:MAG TPA: tetratricopeptide repeat protein, partial [Steroidobacteraceae bacterium]|nr:tetratricopeptide repeat protein [Steroidobacteraceae bacterium]